MYDVNYNKIVMMSIINTIPMIDNSTGTTLLNPEESVIIPVNNTTTSITTINIITTCVMTNKSSVIVDGGLTGGTIGV